MFEISRLFKFQFTMGNQFEVPNSHRTGKLLSWPPLEIDPKHLLMPGEIENKKIVI